MKKQHFPQSIALLLCFSLTFSPVAHAYNQEYADQVANSNLNTFDVVEKEEEKGKKSLEEMNVWEHFLAIFTPRKFTLQDLNERDKRETLFKQAPSAPILTDSIIDASFVKKMELVHGEARANDHLAHRITSHPSGTEIADLTATEFGKKRCIELLTQPISNIDEIKKRQAIIKELVENDELRNDCNAALQRIRQSENELFDLYQYNELPEAERILYFNQFWGETLGLNKSKTALSISTRAQQLFSLVQYGVWAWFPMGYPDWLESKLGKIDQGTKLFLRGYAGCLSAMIFVILSSVQKQMMNMSKNAQQKLIGAATYINGVKKLTRLAGSNQTILANMPSLKETARELRNSPDKSAQFNELTKLLEKSTFSPGSPSFLSSQGNILIAYKHILQESVRREFAQALNTLGEIDLYVALANKIKAHQSEKVHYCFVEFQEGTTPYISATNFWNPFVDIKKVVPNSVTFDSHNMQNMILTGPNTGGKSTFLKALMIDLLLAQTFGIAPADTLVMTPFIKLTSHMNITDDTAGGVSLFKAEVQRAHELMDMVRALSKDEVAFIIIDEIFTGTSPDQAEELSYKFIKQLSEHKNVSFICATHFKKLTEMEQEANHTCKNYHMGAILNEAGKVQKYTYTLTPGPSPIKNAEQVATETGAFGGF